MSISRLSIAALLVLALVFEASAPPLAAPGAGSVTQGSAPRPPAPPEVGCEACVLVDDSGKTLFRRNPAAELPNASTTKMMTALLTVDAGVVGTEVRVSETAAAAGGGGLDLKARELWPVESLLVALLLSSSNDAATALAEHVSGSQEAFVASMNERARAMGLHRTAFVTPHGLDAAGHYSSAADLAAIAEVLLEDPLLRQIVAQTEATVEGPRGEVTIENRNLLLESYDGAIGVKTGYTQGAGNALVSAAVRHGRRLIAVVLRSADSFADSRALLDYGFARLRQSVLLRRGSRVGTVVLDPAGSLRAYAAATVRGIAPPDRVEIAFEPAGWFELPLGARAPVGSVVVTSDGRVVDRVPAVTRTRVDAPATSWAVEGLATVLSWGQFIGG